MPSGHGGYLQLTDKGKLSIVPRLPEIRTAEQLHATSTMNNNCTHKRKPYCLPVCCDRFSSVVMSLHTHPCCCARADHAARDDSAAVAKFTKLAKLWVDDERRLALEASGLTSAAATAPGSAPPHARPASAASSRAQNPEVRCTPLCCIRPWVFTLRSMRYSVCKKRVIAERGRQAGLQVYCAVGGG